MTREIKFRVWDKENKSMLHDYFRVCPDGIIVDSNNQNITSEVELIQYTGLRDRNGKEIYEGDIIKYISREDNINRFFCSDKNLLKADVIYQDFMFTTTGRFNFMVYADECEVIGNIYEN